MKHGEGLKKLTFGILLTLLTIVGVTLGVTTEAQAAPAATGELKVAGVDIVADDDHIVYGNLGGTAELVTENDVDTLVLTSFQHQTVYAPGVDSIIEYYPSVGKELNITLVGENTLEITDPNNQAESAICGIRWHYASVSFDGEGSLSISVGQCAEGSLGIYGTYGCTINGGTISIETGASSDSYSTALTVQNSSAKLTINGGKLSATSQSGKWEHKALYGYVKNTIPGRGWTSLDETSTPEEIEAQGDTDNARKLNYKKVEFISHTHNFTYAADGDTITATCTADGCTLPPSTEGGSDHVAKLTIVKPALATYGEEAVATASLENTSEFNSATGMSVSVENIKYVGRDGTSYEEVANAPTDAGKYTAKITVEGATASVDYEIAPATATITSAPTASEITYGQTLADSTLTGGKASVDGTFAWKDPAIAPAVSDSQTREYDVVFTPANGNYAAAECKTKLTVNKANSKVTKAPAATNPTYNGKAQALVTAGTAEGGTMQYSLDGDTYSEAIPTGTEAKAYTVWYRVVGDENHVDSEAKSVTSTISKKDEPKPAPAKPAKVSKPTTVAHVAAGSIDVSWKKAKGAKSYQVQWRVAGAKKWSTATVKGTKKTITGLKAGKLYDVRVRGVDGSAKGAWSTPARQRWLESVSKAKAKPGTSKGSVKVTWKKDKKATGGYKVFVYAKRGGKAVATKTVSKAKASATITNLKSGKTYYVRVRPLRTRSGKTYVGALCGYRSVKAK